MSRLFNVSFGVVFLSCSLFQSPSFGIAEERTLSGEQIRELVTDKRATGTTQDGFSFEIKLHKNGKVEGSSEGSVDQGIWEIKTDTLCFKWDQWRHGEYYCAHLRIRDDGQYEGFSKEGRLTH